MKRETTRGIIVARTPYGEADRIITFVTPDQGKLHLMARGVRRQKSKLAGGLELFSVSHITFVRGRGDIGTLASSRLDKHFGFIARDLQRTRTAYDCILELHRLTEDNMEGSYFTVLHESFIALEDAKVPPIIAQLWFYARMLTLDGYAPNLIDDEDGDPLVVASNYDFNLASMSFTPSIGAPWRVNDIKFLRLAFGSLRPAMLMRVNGAEQLAAPLVKLLLRIMAYHRT